MKAHYIGWKDLRIRLRDRNTLVLMLLLPVALTAIIGFAFGGDSGISTVEFLVAGTEEDDLISQAAAGGLGSGSEMFQASVLVVIGALVFGVDWGGSPGGLVAVFAAFGAAVSGLSVLLGSVARTTRQAQSAALVLALSMSALGGLWWPLEITPRAYQIAGHVVPTGWAMDAMHGLVSRGHGLPEVLPEVWTLLAFAATFSVAATLAFRSE